MTARDAAAESARSPKLAIVADEDGATWGTALDTEGFFGARAAESHEIELIGCSVDGPLREYCAGRLAGRRVGGNVELRLLDTAGDVLGDYYLTVGAALHRAPHPADPRLFDVRLRVLYFEPPHPLAGPIWERWRRSLPRERGLWCPYPTAGRWAWLEGVGRHHRWDRRRTEDVPAGATFELTGGSVTDEPGFYCAIGEAINGPGGYFGANIDALRDCLRGGFGATAPFSLTWTDADTARRSLGESPRDGEGNSFPEILEVLREGGAEVLLR